MRLHLGGHLNWYDPEKRSRIEIHLSQPTPLTELLRDLGVPHDEVAVSVVNGSAAFSINGVIVRDADNVELYPPVGGGQKDLLSYSPNISTNASKRLATGSSANARGSL